MSLAGPEKRPDSPAVRQTPIRDWQSLAAKTVTFLVVAVLVLPPMLMLIYGSFRTAAPGAPGEFTFEPYRQFLRPRILQAVINTLYLAAGGGVLAVFGGTVMAFLLFRTDTPGRVWLTGLITTSFYVPSFISAAGWFLLGSPNAGAINQLGRLVWSDFQGINILTMGGMIWVMGLIYTPYVFLILRGPFMSMDPSLEEAAWISGAGQLRTVLRISLPLVTYSLVSGFLVTFVQAVGNFGVPGVLGMPARQTVISTQIWQMITFYPADYNSAAALGVALMALTSLTVVVQRMIVSRREYTSITGKGYRPRTLPLGRWRWVASIVCWLYWLLAIGMPISVLIYMSLLPIWTLDPAAMTFSLTNYHEVLVGHGIIGRAFKNTALLALGGASVTVLLAAFVSYFTIRAKWWGRQPLDLLSSMPLAVPGLCIGLGLIWTYISLPIGIYGTIWILVLSFSAHYLPHGVRAVSANMIQLDEALEESARVSGASWGRAFFRIIVPLVRPGMFAGWLILVVAFFRELSSALLLYTPQNEVLSVSIWDLYINGHWGMLSALSVMTLFLIFVIYSLAVWLTDHNTESTAVE